MVNVARLEALAAEHGMDVDTFLDRLLDRDPHDHDHRCPTCARLSQHADDEHVTGQVPLPL